MNERMSECSIRIKNQGEELHSQYRGKQIVLKNNDKSKPLPISANEDSEEVQVLVQVYSSIKRVK